MIFYFTRLMLQQCIFFTCFLPNLCGRVVMLKTGRREVLVSNPVRACRPSRLEFSLVFPETHVNTGQDPLERPPRRTLLWHAQVPQADNWPLSANYWPLLGPTQPNPVISFGDFFKFLEIYKWVYFLSLECASLRQKPEYAYEFLP